MIKNTIFLLSVFFIFSSCYHENKIKVEKPEDLISINIMTEIITDIQLAEGIISHNRGIRVNATKRYKDSLYTKVFKNYGISAETFRENINYYHHDPILMEDVYERVLANLSKIQSEVELEAKKKQKEEALRIKNDSLEALKIKSDSIEALNIKNDSIKE